MRFIVMGMATKESEAGPPPKPEAFAAMQKYNEELVKAGVLLAAEGLTPSSQGVRVKFSGEQRTVIDGPASRDIQGDLAEPLGLHLVDMEVAMGNLVDLVGQQTMSYLDSTRRR